MGELEELIEIAVKFVERQQGAWNHSTWLAFLSDVQEKGFKLSDEMQIHLESVLESIKSLNDTLTDIEGMGNVLLDISNRSVDFIKQTKGGWDHSGWEMFVNDLQKTGIVLTEETKDYVGYVLESLKKFYIFTPIGSE